MKYTEDNFPRSTIQRNGMKNAQSNLINATIQCLNLIGCGMEIMRRY